MKTTTTQTIINALKSYERTDGAGYDHVSDWTLESKLGLSIATIRRTLRAIVANGNAEIVGTYQSARRRCHGAKLHTFYRFKAS